MKYLKLYKECMKTGKIPEKGEYSNIANGGLCSIISKEDLYILTPTEDDLDDIYREYRSTHYWGSELSYRSELFERMWIFGPLRQNIVLFLAAINNEL